jgi:serine/threonine-protein kinase/endoribonuclease IRE1
LSGKKRHPFSPADYANKSELKIAHETEANIMDGKNEGWDQSLSPQATHLTKEMLKTNMRPTTAEVLDHPYFWSKTKMTDFIIAVGNQPEFEYTRALSKRPTPLTAVETDTEKSFSTIVRYGTWNDPRYAHMPAIYAEMTNSRRGRKYYNTGSVIELVRFIRNAYEHVSDKKRPPTIQKNLLEDFVFLEYFPNLVTEVYKAVTTHGWHQKRDEIKYKMKK